MKLPVFRYLNPLSVAAGLFGLTLFSILISEWLVALPQGQQAQENTRLAASPVDRDTSRVFLVIVDGWRWQSADDARLMPQVNELRPLGASGRMETVFEGFSYPAFKAMFEGREDTRLLNAVTNFFGGGSTSSSVFSDLTNEGNAPALAVGYSHFDQFGLSCRMISPPHIPHENQFNIDARVPAFARQVYDSARSRFVLSHIESVDWTGHESGVHSDAYKKQLLHTDSVLFSLYQHLKPGDTFIALGDHGADDKGQHKTGLDIPTFGLFIGPAFEPGAIMNGLPLRVTRILLSEALHLPFSGSLEDRTAVAPLLSEPEKAIGKNVVQTEKDGFRTSFILLPLAGLVVLGLLFQLFRALVPEAPATGFLIFALSAFSIEFSFQSLFSSQFTLFPVILVLYFFLQVAKKQPLPIPLFLTALYLGFLFYSGSGGIGSPVTVFPLWQLVLLYAAGWIARIGAFTRFKTDRKTLVASGTTVLLTLLTGYQILPETYHHLAVSLFLFLAFVVYRKHEWAGIFLTGTLLSLYQFTFQPPIYQLAACDLFLGALALLKTEKNDPFVPFLLVSGTLTFTFFIIPGGLEWGFLFEFFRISDVQYNLAPYLPLILLKFPLLLFTVLRLSGIPPAAVLLPLLLSASIRVLLIPFVSLSSAGGKLRWIAGEQALYLCILLFFAAMSVTFQPASKRSPA